MEEIAAVVTAHGIPSTRLPAPMLGIECVATAAGDVAEVPAGEPAPHLYKECISLAIRSSGPDFAVGNSEAAAAAGEAAKEEGNQSYLAGQFKAALGHYSRAVTLAPLHLLYRLNRAAVLLEMGRTPEAVAVCKRVIAAGRFDAGVLVTACRRSTVCACLCVGLLGRLVAACSANAEGCLRTCPSIRGI